MTTQYGSDQENVDVVVIGGGPGGSTAATLLAKAGHRVTVIERAKFPRDHVGESLLPYCYGLCEKLGVLEEMKKRYVKKPGVRFLDRDGTTQTTYCFGHKIHDQSYLSFHVLRSEFDELLLNNSAANGAEVLQERKVEHVDFDDPDDVIVRSVGPEGEMIHRAKFVIDASGRDTFLANRMKTKIANKNLERTALGSHWRGIKYEGGLAEGLIQILYTGGEKQGWIWVIPLERDRVSCGVVMNSSYYRQQRAKLKAEGHEDVHFALYRQELGESSFIRDAVFTGEQFWPVIYNGDYSYTVAKKWGERYALVGDAGTFIDPIFSSGVYLAMNSAFLLADAVDVRLDKGGDAADEAFESVYGKINGAYELVDKLIQLFYTPESVNFAQLGSAAGSLFDQRMNSISLQHFLLAGDFFEESNRYSDFVDLLRDPRTFDRYKKLVIDRPTLNSVSCDESYETVFPESLVAVAAERVERGI